MDTSNKNYLKPHSQDSKTQEDGWESELGHPEWAVCGELECLINRIHTSQ